MKLWQLQDAKRRLNEIVDAANVRGAQTITRHGKPIAVVFSWTEWTRRMQPTDSLADWLARCPRTGLSDREIDRLFRRRVGARRSR